MFQNNVLALDIGSYSIKAVLGRHQNNNIIIENTFVINTPVDCIDDGRISDMNKLYNVIHGLIESNKLKVKKIAFSVNSSSIINREITVPLVKSEEMHNVVKYEIEQYLPIVLDEYDIEFKIQEEFIEDKVRKCKLYVAVAPKSMVQGYLELAKQLKMTPVLLDINSNSAARMVFANTSVNEKMVNSEDAGAIIDIGYEQINVSIVSKGALQFNRLLTRGSKEIDELIADSMNMSLYEAHEYIHKHTDELDCMRNSNFNSIIDSWMEDIQRIFQYYNNRSNGRKLDTIYLCGGGANLKSLSQYISNSLNMPVEVTKSFGNIRLAKFTGELDTKTFINAIGLLSRKLRY